MACRQWMGFLAAAALACTTGSALAQSAVGNAGFEIDPLYDVPPAAGNWTGFFAGPSTAVLAAARNTTAPRTGASALYLKVAVEGSSFAGMQQPVTGIQPGVSYTMGIWARRAGNINNGVEYRIEWKNSSGGIIGDQFALTTRIDGALTNSYQQFTLTAIAPVGAAGANLVVAAQTFAFNPVTPVFDTEAYIDDVTFVANSLPGQAACCLPDGSCVVAVVGACPSGSTQQAPGTVCTAVNCTPQVFGACCNRSTAACAVIETASCTALGGQFRGANTTCSPNQCTVTVCRADFNGVGGVSVQDIFDFLTAWFTGCP